MKETKISEDTTEKNLFLISSLFVSFHEISLQILTEFSLAIAVKKKTHDRNALQFINQYTREKNKGRTILKQDLVNFLKNDSKFGFQFLYR